MYRLIKFYNQNRKAIIKAILIIAFLFILLMIFNNNAKNNKQIPKANIDTETISSNNVLTDKSLVTGDSINTKKINEDVNIIETFLNYCKTNNIEQAYNCISNSCKDQLFATIDDFNIIYVDLFFDNKNILYTIENWYDNTYKITIKENALSTGKNTEYSKQDYITVVDENGEKRLNINGFINKKEINKQKTSDEINIKIIDMFQYMDYTVVNIEIQNNSETQFLLDDLENIKSIYIQDNNDVKYNLYTHELAQNELLVLPKQSKKLRLKFYSKFISTKSINKIVFSNVFINYRVQDNEQKKQYSIDI